MLAADEPPRDATEVRFSIRSLLVATAVIAVCATALGTFLRHFPKDAQPRLLLYWACLALIFLGLIIYHGQRRRIAERQAGHTLFLLNHHSYFLPEASGCATITAGIMLLCTAPALWVLGSFIVAEADTAFIGAFGWHSLCAVMVSGAGLTLLWWRRPRLTENGLLLRNHFVPWESCTRWYWDACNKNVVVIQFAFDDLRFEQRPPGQVAAKVPGADRDAIAALLSQRMVKKAAKRSFQVT